MTNARQTGAIAIGIVAVGIALVPLVRGGEDIPTGLHHLLHAAEIAVAAACGLVAASPRATDRKPEHPMWLLAAVGAPIVAMVLMWPSRYAWLDQHPLGHAVEHLALVLLGFLSAFGGQRYARGIGWASSLVLVAMAVVAAFGFGVAPPPSTLSIANAPEPSATLADTSAGDAARGKQIYDANCAACHGATGTEGGVGPSLKAERTRKNFLQTAAWVRNPRPPMPRLFPSPLSAKDVADVAAYVQRL